MDFPYYYSRSGPSIRRFHRSPLTLKLLTDIREGLKTNHELVSHNFYTETIIRARLKYLEDSGFTRRTENGLELTNSGCMMEFLSRQLVTHFERLFQDTSLSSHDLTANTYELPYFERPAYRFLQSILLSGLKTTVLVSLIEDSRTRDEMRTITRTSSSSLTPQIRWLESQGLVKEQGYHLHLTGPGRDFAPAISDYLLSGSVILRFQDFWNSHTLDALPEFALIHLYELADMNEITDTYECPYRNYENISALIENATSIYSVFNYPSLAIADLIIPRLRGGMPLEVIITDAIADKASQSPHFTYLRNLRSCPALKIYIARLSESFGLVMSDRYLSLTFTLLDSNIFDTARGLVSSSPEALAWGERLFNHFKSQSVPIDQYISTSTCANLTSHDDTCR